MKAVVYRGPHPHILNGRHIESAGLILSTAGRYLFNHAQIFMTDRSPVQERTFHGAASRTTVMRRTAAARRMNGERRLWPIQVPSAGAGISTPA
jgi:hypothetical protein